jgi:hypothetical protein
LPKVKTFHLGRSDLVESALRVLDESPAAPVRVRLLRDVLGRQPGDRELDAAVEALDESPHVKILAQEQRTDGSWGRFHSKDYSAKQKIGRTEQGVQRAIELGLPRSHPVLRKVQPYLEAVLDGRVRIPDRAEKHENWPTGVAMFAGAMLAAFAPEARALDQTWEFWSGVLRRSFATGRHDLDAELRAHRQLLGRSGQCGWMRLRSKYPVMILGSRVARLPPATEAAYVQYLWEECPRGLVYLNVPLNRDPQKLRGWSLHGWLRLLELLSAFASSRPRAQFAVERLLSARNRDGLWDFGVQPSCPRLSDNYRKKGRIAHDWTTRVVCLLSRYAD